MPGINLLPGDLKPKGYAIRISKTLKEFATVSLIIFFITLVLFIASSIMLSLQRRSLLVKKERLNSEVKALEASEQKLILVEDRLGKIDLLLKKNAAYEEIEIFQSMATKNVPNINIVGAKLDKDTAVIEVTARSASDLTNYFSEIISSNFKKVELLSFNFDSQKGYRIKVGISK